jgi:protein-S-isoprenylcysteine O-methyltransferase Ste14
MSADPAPEMGDGRWVALQALALAGVLVAVPLFGALSRWPLERPTSWSLALGAAVIAVAAVLGWRARRALGAGFTPRPTPPPGGRLVESGPFARVRHPMYTAVLLGAAGYALLWPTLQGFGWVVILAVVLGSKARHEERLLVRRYPGYADYAARVPRRLVPGGGAHHHSRGQAL